MTTLQPLSIGPLHLDVPVVLAPMAGVTNAAFRALCRAHGGGLYVSEMIATRALLEQDRKTLNKAAFGPDESPRSIQLYGVAAEETGRAAKALVEQHGVDHIDLNFGCPAPKVTRHGGGAALPWRLGLFRDIVAAAVENAGSVPVTVKLRMGIDDAHITYLDAGRAAADAGAAAVALHARTAEQAYGGSARWEAIRELVEALPGVPVLGNGDIWTADDALRMVAETGCAGVVVGRGCLGRPWLFAHLDAAFTGRPLPELPTLGEVADLFAEHAVQLAEHMGEDRGVRDLRKHVTWYFQGFPVGGDFRRDLNRTRTIAEVERLLGGLDRSVVLPEAARTMHRGHTHGPKRVKLPEGWLTSRDDVTPLTAEAALVVSGG